MRWRNSLGVRLISICKWLWIGDCFCVRDEGVCPLFLSALEPQLVQTCAGLCILASVSVSSYVHWSYWFSGHSFLFLNDSLVSWFCLVLFLFVCLLACLIGFVVVVVDYLGFVWFFLLFVFVFVLHVCLYEGVRSPGTTGTDICELPCGFWKLNQGPPEEQPVLLTSEPSLQPPRGGCFSWCPLSSLAVIVFLFPLSQCSWAPRGGVW